MSRTAETEHGWSPSSCGLFQSADLVSRAPHVPPVRLPHFTTHNRKTVAAHDMCTCRSITTQRWKCPHWVPGCPGCVPRGQNGGACKRNPGLASRGAPCQGRSPAVKSMHGAANAMMFCVTVVYLTEVLLRRDLSPDPGESKARCELRTGSTAPNMVRPAGCHPPASRRSRVMQGTPGRSDRETNLSKSITLEPGCSTYVWLALRVVACFGPHCQASDFESLQGKIMASNVYVMPDESQSTTCDLFRNGRPAPLEVCSPGGVHVRANGNLSLPLGA
jgi:hypothetical protein